MDSHKNLDSLLALAKNNYSELSDMQPGLESLGLSDAELHDIYLTAVKANLHAISIVPSPRRDEEILIAVIMHKEAKNQIDGIIREFLNKDNSTYNILVAICRQDIQILIEIKKNWEQVSTEFNLTEQQTYVALCLDVLKNNWRAMRAYPSTLIEDITVTEAIQQCKSDVSQDWRDIIYVPEYLLEDAFFQPSILKAQQAIISGELEIAPFTSQKILTEKGCMAAVARDAYNFRNIPSILRTNNVCREAIKLSLSGWLDFLRNPEDRLGLTNNEYKALCREAIEIYGPTSLYNIPSNMRTYDLCLAALNKGVEALQFLSGSNDREGLKPGEYNTLCLEAVKIYGAKAMHHTSREMRTIDYYVTAINSHIDVLQFLKENYNASELTSSEYANLLQLASDKYGMEAVLKYIPPEMRTKTLWISAVTANASELYDLKVPTKTTGLTEDDYQDIRLAAVMGHGRWALMSIDPEVWNYELCRAVVNKEVEALDNIATNQKRIPLKPDEYAAIFSMAKDKYGIEKIFPHLPPQLRTYDLCLEAIKKDRNALRELEKAEDRVGLKPGEYNKLCLEAIETHGEIAIYCIPSEMRTYDLCFEAIKKDRDALRRLEKAEDRAGLKPGEYNKLCLEAIELYGYSALYSIEPEMRTYEVCLAAVNKEISALGIIKQLKEQTALTTDQYAAIISIAKSKYGIEETFRWIPAEMRTYDLWLEVIKINSYILYELEKPEERAGLKPDEYNKLCLEALKIHGLKIFRYILSEMWTYDLCLAAVTIALNWLEELQINRDQTKLTPDEYTKIYLEAYKVHGSSALSYFPTEMRTYDVYLDAVKNDAQALRYLKDYDRDRFKPGEYLNICLAAIETHGCSVLVYVDSDILTYDVLLAAVNKGVTALYYAHTQKVQNKLTEQEYIALCTVAKDKYDIKETFRYLPPEMKTYDVCLAAFAGNVDVLQYLNTANDRKKLTTKEYTDLCLMIIKAQYAGTIDPKLTDDILINFIVRYEKINKFNNYTMDDIGTFFSKNVFLISKLYPFLGKHIFVLMEKMLTTSADNLNRFLREVKLQSGQALVSCSKNISRLLENVDYKNANKKASQFKLYLSLSSEEKEEINILLDNSATNIETIPNVMRELLIKKFYDYLSLTYNNKGKNAIDTLSNEELANLNGLLEVLKKNPDKDKSKMFFSMLKMYLGGIPFQYLHQPDEMSKKGDAYMVKMAEHNKKLRADLAAGGIHVNKAFSYKKQTPLTFDEHHKQKTLETLGEIYKKLKESTADNKHIKNLITQIDKGKKEVSEEAKLLKMLSESNLTLLNKIADSELPDIKTKYLDESTKLTFKPEVLINYQPRKFHIEMWDKSKIETLFLGDYLSCCLATTGSMNTEYAARVFDDAFLMPVIIDETTKRPVCGAWLFLGETTKPPSTDKTIDTVANFFEINAGIAENKELMNFLVVNLLNYIGQFSESIKAAEFIMRPLSYGMIPDFNNFGAFSATDKRTIEKVGGYFGNDKYYLNAVGTENFYQFDQAKFGERMRKLIVPEPKAPEYASSMTLGFTTKPTSVAGAEDSPDKEPPSNPTHSHKG